MAGLIALSGCYPWARPPITIPFYALVSIDPAHMVFKDDLDRKDLMEAIEKSLIYYSRLPQTRAVDFGPEEVTVARLVRTMEAFRAALKECQNDWTLTRRLREDFRVYQAQGRDYMRRVLMTGYFEPVLPGSRVKTDRFRWPIYQKPPDLHRLQLGGFRDSLKGKTIVARCENGQVVPYYTRREIDKLGALRGRGLELFWLDDPVRVFFLHVQGSGAVMLPDGETVQVNYHASNGREYRSIGRYLVENGYLTLEEVSMDSIMAFLKENPGMMEEVLFHNDSYVFFREVDEGPIGSLGVPVTAMRTIATDPALFPRGSLAFLRGEKPVFDDGDQLIGWEPFSRFVLNQDSGGAIKGTGRLDLFMGRGERAKFAASHLKHDCKLYFILLRE